MFAGFFSPWKATHKDARKLALQFFDLGRQPRHAYCVYYRPEEIYTLTNISPSHVVLGVG